MSFLTWVQGDRGTGRDGLAFLMKKNITVAKEKISLLKKKKHV